MKTYYMITKSLTFFVNIEEGKTFHQDIAKMLIAYRGLGCNQYYFDDINPKRAFSINLTSWYNDYYKEFYL